MSQANDSLKTLDRKLSVLCFDWDRIGVASRDEDLDEMRSLVQRLGALDVDVWIVSEAALGEIDGRLRARPDAEGHLFLFLSGGSEVHVVGSRGPRLLARRQSDEAAAARLDAVAAALREELATRGLDLALVHDGSHRWRIDLGPARIASEALDELADCARGLMREAGLTASGVSADARHLYIGYADRRDRGRAVLRALIEDRRRDPAHLLIVGDEVQGLIPVADEAWAGGSQSKSGSAGDRSSRLRGILRDQLQSRMDVARASFPAPTPDPAWCYTAEGFDPFREREIETLLTIANGESGTRGSVEEGSAVSTPTTLVAGVFGDGTAEPRFRQPAPAPDWAGLRLIVDGLPLHLANGEILKHERVLDMYRGVVYRLWRQRDGNGRLLAVRTARFASLADRQILAVRAEATLEDRGGRLIWQGAVGISYAGGAIKETQIQSLDSGRLIARTAGRAGGGHVLAVTTRPATGSPVVRYVEQGRDVIGGRLEPGDPATVDRLAAIVSARTRTPSPNSALRALARAERLGYDELLRRHAAAWDARWRDADLVVDGDAADQQALRFSVFHMISSAHPTKDTVSVGARGLSGMSYFLHVFWDTEIFVLPFFIYTHPQTARTLLAYRYRNLPGAREKARQMRHRGALYPWESADKGVETTPAYGFGPGGEVVPILSGFMEHHISADVAWAVWEYWKATADDAFMAAMGVEMMLETARFWASRADVDEHGRHHIRLVVGPDEYHEGVDDNAYTNVLARWNIVRAAEALRWLERVDSGYAAELTDRMDLTRVELDQWRAVAGGMVDGFDPETLLYEQFAGFYHMDDVPPEKLRPRPLAADVMLGREVTLRSKVVKQADVVMLTHVLSDEISDAVAMANYDYYEPITAHGSSLSPGMHAAVAARLGRVEDAVDDFKMATAIDLGDTMGNAARGLHLATMGSVWQAAVMGFAGIQRRDRALLVDPHLPPAWTAVSVPLLFRGARLRFDFRTCDDGLELGITVERAAVRLILDGVEREFRTGRHAMRRVGSGTWQEVEQ
ncbi:MAG TPA: glycoside hydrolase family 65 protein [Thermoleophilia bacterium]|nr:glycoside hydrolase family 65 protein [Thermoleophilia bacterium]